MAALLRCSPSDFEGALSKADAMASGPPCAGVVKLVDTPDSKSGASNSVPVQVRPPVPTFTTARPL